jgi:catechol 2,3-dioxygenase-like lactoylglutathione lyase family enzyme
MWWGTAIEAPDPSALAAFYCQLLGWPVVHQEPGDQRTMMHLDIQVADLDAATADAEILPGIRSACAGTTRTDPGQARRWGVAGPRTLP